MAVRQADEAHAERALEELCQIYWHPVYAFVRRLGHNPQDAQDLTQGFFAHMLERGRLVVAQPEKGRFRSFLLGALQKFLANQARSQSTIRRGGEITWVSINEELGEQWYQRDLSQADSPERAYYRSWLESLLNSTLELLRGEYAQAGKLELFQRIQPHLAGAGDESSYMRIADQMGLSLGAVTTSVHRMRRRYGELLREGIAQTVQTPEEIDDEIAFLFSTCRSG